MSLNSEIELYMNKMESILNIDVIKKILTILMALIAVMFVAVYIQHGESRRYV